MATKTDDDDLEPRPRKVTRKAKIRVAVALGIALLATGAWAYVRYGVHKSPLGGPCNWAMNCLPEAPRCMRPTLEGEGVCSRQCEPDADCAPGIHCIMIELDDVRDDRGVPLKSGYCFPQSFLDAKKGRPAKDAGPPLDSWVDVPSAGIEGEIAYRWERPGAPPSAPKTYLVKGSLVRVEPSPAEGRVLVDTQAMRIYRVNDARQTFSATALALDAPPANDVVTKTFDKGRVLGKDCDTWLLESGANEKREACVVQGASFVDLSARVPPWQQDLAVRRALPLRVIERDRAGRETARFVAVRFEPRLLDAALFAIPKAYMNLAGR